MQEVLEQVIDYLKGIWLKRRYIIIATWLICPIGWIMVSQLDDVYKSEARVYADTQSILRPLLRGLTVETNPDTQLKLMVKTLLSRPNLERIARMTDLDINASNTAQFEGILDQLKNGIKISQTRGRANIFTIAYTAKDPEIAKKVVQSALTVFIENTLGDNRTDNDSAQEFLDAQIKEYEARLNEDESKVTAFKQKYNDILPGSGGYYSQLKTEKEKLATAELELKELNTQLASAKSQLASSNQQSGSLSDNIEDNSRVATSFDERIKSLENNLDNLLLRFTDKHPDVVEVQRLVNSLKEARKKELESYYQNLAKNDASGNGTASSLSTNPIYQEMQIQVNQLENAAASLTVRVNNYKNKVADLENRIHTIPEIEQELIALNRGYEITLRKYNDLLNRKETASLAKSADDNTNKIEFRVIDPPRSDIQPAGPNRNLFFIGVMIAGFGAGIGLSFLFSQLNPVVTSASQISRATGIPVFGIVSATENLGLKKWHQRKTLIFIASNSLLVLLLIGFMAFFMFPDLIQAPLRRVF